MQTLQLTNTLKLTYQDGTLQTLNTKPRSPEEGSNKESEESREPLRGPYIAREEELVKREKEGALKFVFLRNDDGIHTLKLLTDLKNIFSRQLPNMPKDYIAKLVFDKSHRSVAVFKESRTLIGGITYKVFSKHLFAEIAFCAVEGIEQVQGIGSRLMNYCKSFARKFDHIERFLTYADNNAIGYFTKQGFVKRVISNHRKSHSFKYIKHLQSHTKEVSLHPCEWVGFIKEYDGGTLMECEISDKAPYLNSRRFLAKHKKSLEASINSKSSLSVIHPGLSFPEDNRKRRRVNPESIPGVREAGWTLEQLNRNLHFKIDGLWQQFDQDRLHEFLESVIQFLKQQTEITLFLKPVSIEQAIDYFDVIKDPMDLSLIEVILRFEFIQLSGFRIG